MQYFEELNQTPLITALLFKVTQIGIHCLAALQIMFIDNLQPAISLAL